MLGAGPPPRRRRGGLVRRARRRGGAAHRVRRQPHAAHARTGHGGAGRRPGRGRRSHRCRPPRGRHRPRPHRAGARARRGGRAAGAVRVRRRRPGGPVRSCRPTTSSRSGRSSASLLATPADDLEPIPDRRFGGRLRRPWTGVHRRALLFSADQAMADDARQRPTARALAAAIRHAVPDATLGDAAAPTERQPRRPLPSLRRVGTRCRDRGGTGGPRRRPAAGLRPRSVNRRSPRRRRRRLPRPPRRRTPRRRPPPPPSPHLPAPTSRRTVADVDGDGCPEPVAIEGGIVEVGGVRYEVGVAGDDVAVGDWDCDGRATPALLRSATGEVFVFPAWAEPGHDLTVAAVDRSPATPAASRRRRPLPRALVERDDGTQVAVIREPRAEPTAARSAVGSSPGWPSILVLAPPGRPGRARPPRRLRSWDGFRAWLDERDGITAAFAIFASSPSSSPGTSPSSSPSAASAASPARAGSWRHRRRHRPASRRLLANVAGAGLAGAATLRSLQSSTGSSADRGPPADDAARAADGGDELVLVGEGARRRRPPRAAPGRRGHRHDAPRSPTGRHMDRAARRPLLGIAEATLDPMPGAGRPPTARSSRTGGESIERNRAGWRSPTTPTSSSPAKCSTSPRCPPPPDPSRSGAQMPVRIANSAARTAAGRGDSAQAQGDLVREQAALDGEDRARPSTSGHESWCAGRRAGRAAHGTPVVGAQRELQALEPAGRRRRGPRRRPPATRPLRPPRCSARASARSTTADRRGASGRRSRCRGSRPAPSRGGCGGTRGRAGPSSRSRTNAGRPPPAAPPASRYLSAWSSSSGWRAGSSASGVPASTVSAYALTCGGSRASTPSSVRSPVGERLPRPAVDHVEVERLEAGRPGVLDGTAPPRPGRACARARRSTYGTIDCTPNDSRVTPPARYVVEQLRRSPCRGCTRR